MERGDKLEAVILITILIVTIIGAAIMLSRPVNMPLNTQDIRLTSGEFNESIRCKVYIDGIQVRDLVLTPGQVMNFTVNTSEWKTLQFGLSNGNQTMNIRFCDWNGATAPPKVICIIVTNNLMTWVAPTDTSGGPV